MNPLKLLHRSRHQSTQHAAHITWASRTVAGTVAKTRAFLTRQIWVWPIIAVTLLLLIGWLVHGKVEGTMKANLVSQLETVLDVEVAMLRTWLTAHESNATTVVGDMKVRELAAELLAEDAGKIEGGRERSAIVADITNELGPLMHAHDYENYLISDRNTILAASRPDAVDLDIPPEFSMAFEHVYDGQPTVLPPFGSLLPVVDRQGRERTGVPLMYVLAPIVDERLQVVAVLGLQIRPEGEFTRLLQLGRLGVSGETYAFNRQGLMLSNSRFEEELILLRLLPDEDGSQSILHIDIRDPGGDMEQGYNPTKRRSELSLTKMAASATSGVSGMDIDGYRDYRGVKVVGAWRWLDDYGFGVATEIDHAEAYRPLTILKRTFWALLVLLALSSLAIFVFTLLVARLQRKARAAAIEARQLGQYKLEEKLGEGAMGVVYKGRHSMLRRPTAIKLLDADKVNETSIARFEREVQITSHLNHPNTIAIYDYGHTPEGVFYYAMEYLDGIDLQHLVDTYGPQSPGRVIYVLGQMCGSLYEAHSTGLVHRDIKPANVMLNRRGGEGDVVKVLDFGLVKAREGEFGEERDETTLAGTPLYMSPEAIQLPNSVDACSDLYAVGAVGSFLLTGRPVFEAENLVELCQLHTSEPPVPPSTRLGKAVPQELEDALMMCLEKQRAKRPQTARDLANRLQSCPAAADWSVDKADAWWGQYERGQATQATTTSAAKEFDATLAHDG